MSFRNANNVDASHSVFNSVGGNLINITAPGENGYGFLRKSLEPAYHACHDPGNACMEGTRVKILREIALWSKNGSEKILWLHGLAGSGKTTLASSIAEQLAKGHRLAGSFFCKRDDADLRSSKNVLPTLCYQFAKVHKPFSKKLSAVLHRNTDLRHAHIQVQYTQMLAGPLQKIPGIFYRSLSPWVFIIDALDECGSLDGRAQLMRALQALSRLVPWIKIIITSRSNDDIQTALLHKLNQCPVKSLDLGQAEDVYGDIVHFIRSRLDGNGSWLQEEAFFQLACQASGLFIWAQTACKFVTEAIDKEKRLKLVLRGGVMGDAITQLDNLYTIALKETIPDGEDNTNDFQVVVGAIVTACVPLHPSTLRSILGPCIGDHVLDTVVNLLGCVLHKNEDGSIRVCHPSFSEFLTSKKRCNERFWIKPENANFQLACRCLDIMMDQLKFNICALESSHLFNHQVPDLDNRVASAVSPELQYSCLYWIAHLTSIPTKKFYVSSLSFHMERFFFEMPIFFWVECLSLLGELRQGLFGLVDMMAWIEDSNSRYFIAARDFYRFLFFLYTPISMSTPHLYVSGFTFMPQFSMIFEKFVPLVPKILTIQDGRHGWWPSRLLTITGPTDFINSVAFSPDSQLIAAGSDDKSVWVWDSRTGAKVMEPLQGHSAAVWCVAFSPDGQYLASGSDDATICIWDAQTGASVSELIKGHQGSIRCLAFSPSSEKLVSGSCDNNLCIWDVKAGAQTMKALQGHTDYVECVTFSPNGQHIASGSDDATVHIWNALTGVLAMKPLLGHSDHVHGVAFSPDSQQLVSASDDMTVRVWDLQKGELLMAPLVGHTNWVFTCAFSPDGQLIVSGGADYTVRIWDAKTGASITQPLQGHTHWVRSVAFSPDNQHIVSGSADRTVWVWDAKTGAPVSDNLQEHTSCVRSAVFSPDGQCIVSGSDDKTLRLWNAATGTCIAEPIHCHTDWISSVAFCPENKYIASGSGDGTIHIWDLKSEASCAVLQCKTSHTIRSVAFSPNSQLLVAGCDNGSAQIWNASTWKLHLEPLKGHTNFINCVVFSPDSRKIVSGSGDSTICVWDVKSGNLSLEPLRGHTSWVCSVAVSPDGQCIASGSVDKTVRVWNMESGTLLMQPFQGHTDWIFSVAFSPDGRHIASGSDDKTIRIWDARTGATVIGPLTGHTNYVRSVAYSPNGQHLVSGSDDGTYRVWEVGNKYELKKRQTSQPLSNIREPPYQMNKEGWIVLDGSLILWVPPGYRQSFLSSQRQLYCIPPSAQGHSITFDTSQFVHGADWVKVLG